MLTNIKITLGLYHVTKNAQYINNMITVTLNNHELDSLYRAVALYDAPMLAAINGDHYRRIEWISTLGDPEGGTITLRFVD